MLLRRLAGFLVTFRFLTTFRFFVGLRLGAAFFFFTVVFRFRLTGAFVLGTGARRLRRFGRACAVSASFLAASFSYLAL